MKPVTNLSTIISNYNALILDLWGVVHDGTHLYPGVHETLTKLRAADKKIVMLSNAPRRARKAEAVLNQLGVERHLYDHILTSGEMGFEWLRENNPSPIRGEVRRGAQLETARDTCPHPSPPPMGEGISCRYYYIGPSKDADVLDGLDYIRVDDIKLCDFLLNVGFGSEEESGSDWSMLLRAAKAQGLPMLCLNPDFEVVKISGERFACAGVIAADYERMGGSVKYFGKPFPEVYARCMEWFALPKEKILAIGDGIATDIAGAVNFGIDSVLVTGGIIKKESPEAVKGLCEKMKAVPNYVMPALAW